MLFLEQLDLLLKERYQSRPEGAYTTQLFNAGSDRIVRKLGEELAEVIVATKNNDHKELTHEAADLLFHLMVVLHDHGLSLSDVSQELAKRHHQKEKNQS